MGGALFGEAVAATLSKWLWLPMAEWGMHIADLCTRFQRSGTSHFSPKQAFKMTASNEAERTPALLCNRTFDGTTQFATMMLKRRLNVSLDGGHT
jgi:hypothetical protein